jgi:predicted RNase H-like nuclease/ppGpp synthetase/RelA/SpoT-type nucleotidyltranferase
MFAGIDLAWGSRAPTGLAVIDEHGGLRHLSSVHTDEEIVETLRPLLGRRCLVAIDAPLVVRNPTGNRPAEAALNHDFARFDAGAHPSNTGRPELSATPRGARIAEALGLDMDPESRRRRRAIEVYPHPATVAWFRLPRTLKYKAKPGRSLAGLRTELLKLTDLLETLDQEDPPLQLAKDPAWRELVDGIRTAGRKSDLRHAEDQVDAVVCAQVAAFSVARPRHTTTYGDLATGYIVTPSLPAGHEPGPRARASAEHAADVAIRGYAGRLPRLQRAVGLMTELLTTMLDDAGINYLTVTGRAKSTESFAVKARRTENGRRVFADPTAEIADQVGLRVITYMLSDVVAVVELLNEQLTVLSDRDLGRETAKEGRFGYASRHLQVTLDADRAGQAELADLAGLQVQVQIRTVLQHAWAEFEHDIRYKGTVPDEHAPDLDRRFTLAAGLLELADQEFSAIRDRLQAGLTDRPPRRQDDEPRIVAAELAPFLAGQYSDSGWSRTDHYAWIADLLLELGITSLEELRSILGTVDESGITRAMGYRHPPSAVRRLDDALLAHFGTHYLGLAGNAHRVDLLRGRLARFGATVTGLDPEPGPPVD